MRNKIKRRKVYIQDDLFRCSVALRKLFRSVGDTDLIRTLLRIAVFELRTEKRGIREVKEAATSYVSRENVFFSRKRGRDLQVEEMEALSVNLQPEDQVVLHEIKTKLARLTGNNKYMIDTVTIRFLVYYYGSSLI